MRDFEIQLEQQRNARKVWWEWEKGGWERAGVGIRLSEMCSKLQHALCRAVL